MVLGHLCFGFYHKKSIFLLCIAVTVLCLFVLPVTAEAATYQPLSFSNEAVIARPVACVSDSSGCYYICDAYYHQVVVLNSSASKVMTLNDPLKLPIDLAVTSDHIYVLDQSLCAVAVFDKNGAYVKTLGEKGLAPGQFDNPSDIFIDNGELYVVDTGNHRIQVFDAESLAFSRILGLEVGNIDLDTPTAAAVKDDTLYIVEKGGSAIIAADKNSGAQRSSSLTLSAEQNRGIAVYGSELVLSSPGSKIITRYDLSLNQIEQINTPVRLYRLDYMSDGKLLGCGSTVQTQDSVVYQFSSDFSDYTIVPPPSDSSIKSPYAAVTDSAGNYYIASHGDDKIQIYNRNYVYQSSITHSINAPLDIAYNNGLLYVLNSDKTIQVFNTSGTYLNTYNVDFAANPMRFDVISATQLVVVDASSLYFVNLDGSTVTPYQKTHASANFPRDVTIHDGKIYYLCNLKGDILVYNSDGVLLNYGAVSGYSYHPTAAVSIAATEDGTLYVCDEDNASLYRYDNSLNDIARYPLSSYGVSSPYTLFGYEQDILVCQPINNEVGIFSASAYTGGFIIKVDGDVISDFSSDVFSYDFKVTADTEHVDLGCVVSGGYNASGSIGRYLLDYGLNTFNIKVTNDGNTDTYKLYVTRAYPDGFLPTEETIDAFIAYTAASEDALPLPAEKKKVSSIRLELNFKNMNPDAVEIMPMSKHVNAVLRGNELTISWDEAGIDTSPSVLLSSSDSFGGLDEQAVKEMIKQRRNLFIILASLAGAAVIFFMHFFTLYLRSHPGKRQYLKHKFKNK